MSFLPRWLFRYRRYDLFEAVPIATSPSLPKGYDFRPATVHDTEALSAFTRTSRCEVQRRFAFGDSCFVVWRDARPASVFWIHRGACYVRGAGFYLAADLETIYLYDAYTPPAYRRKGLYKAGLRCLTNVLVDRGAKRITQLVEPGNRPVLRTIPQLGYTRTLKIRHLRILGLGLTSCVGASPVAAKFRPVTRPDHCFQI